MSKGLNNRHNTNYRCDRGYISPPCPFVCWLVCFVCQQDFTKTTEQSTTKLGGRIRQRPTKSPLHLGLRIFGHGKQNVLYLRVYNLMIILHKYSDNFTQSFMDVDEKISIFRKLISMSVCNCGGYPTKEDCFALVAECTPLSVILVECDHIRMSFNLIGWLLPAMSMCCGLPCFHSAILAGWGGRADHLSCATLFPVGHVI